MEKILNLTPLLATEVEVENGVINLPEIDRSAIKALLDFNRMPDKSEITRICSIMANIAMKNKASKVLLGHGIPHFLISTLEKTFNMIGIRVVYSIYITPKLPQVDYQFNGFIQNVY